MYYGQLQNGREAAIKKLDQSGQPDSVFLDEVGGMGFGAGGGREGGEGGVL